MPQNNSTVVPSVTSIPTNASNSGNTDDSNNINNNSGRSGSLLFSDARHQSRAGHSAETNNMNAGMSRALAHSTSLLANDSYIAGMSSDSELTSNRHHNRPYSSQSRVYHAHPAPRNSHTSSRVSHYSDSAASSYVPSLSNKIPPYDANGSVNSSGGVAASSGSVSSSSNTTTSGQQRPQQYHHSLNQPRSLGNPHLTTESSLASSGSAASTTSLPPGGTYYQTTTGLTSPQLSDSSAGAQNTLLSGALPQQGSLSSSSITSSRPLITSSGRQLPHRPFKQSLSIDQYSSPLQHQHMISSAHQHHLTGTSGRQPASPRHFDSVDVSATAYQQQGNLDNQQQRLLHHDQMSRYDQRDFRAELDMIEKQTAALRLYDDNDTSSGLPPIANRVTAPSSSSPRHLPTSSPVAGGSSVSSGTGQVSSSLHHQHHHHHQQQQQQFHPMDHQQGQVSRKQDQPNHHLSDLYAAHKQYSSSPVDWLPPIGSAHNSNRANPSQIKQTMSIDHYPAAMQQQQHNQQFYSPNRQNLREHYRAMGYTPTNNNSPVSNFTSESPNHHQVSTDYMQQQRQSTAGNFENQSATPVVGDMIYHQYASNPEHHRYDQRLADQQRQLHESTRYSSGTSPALSYPNHQDLPLSKGTDISKEFHQQQQQLAQQQTVNKLPYQMSSSSSDSRSGSLKSSNADLNRSCSLEQQAHKSSSSLLYPQQHDHPHQHPHHHQHQEYQQQHIYKQQQHQATQRVHGMLRRGHTSMVSGLGGSVTALNESLDLSPSHTSHVLHLTSSSGGGVGPNKRSGLRAPSPSTGFDSNNPGMAGRHQLHQNQPYHSSSTSKEVSGVGSRSESSTGLPNGGGGGSSTLTKKSNSATQLSMTGTKKRLGFRRKQVTSFSVHRSEEVAPLEARHLVKQGSSVSEGDSSMSGDSSSRSWSNSNLKQPTSDELASMSFIDGLGKGQMISRQGLASPYLGDIQLSLCDRRGNLEVEIIRARNLQAKTNKVLPLTYVKLYLVKNRKCLAKAKTTLSNKRTLDPLFQQQLTFHEDYHGCILQELSAHMKLDTGHSDYFSGNCNNIEGQLFHSVARFKGANH